MLLDNGYWWWNPLWMKNFGVWSKWPMFQQFGIYFIFFSNQTMKHWEVTTKQQPPKKKQANSDQFGLTVLGGPLANNIFSLLINGQSFSRKKTCSICIIFFMLITFSSIQFNSIQWTFTRKISFLINLKYRRPPPS